MARRGIAVDLSPSGADALRMIEDSDYDVVVTDLSMPDMNGLALIAHLRDMAVGARFVVATGMGECDADPDVHVVAKPWNDAALAELLHRLAATTVAA